jgi:SAM-dependent methyltransferase
MVCVHELPPYPLARTFDTAADLYEEARPDYPAELIEDLVRLADVRPGDRLLEIGCATGKATRALLERGFSIVCVEPGARLAARARSTHSGYPLQIHVTPFELWDGPPGGFDLVFAATAWHWLDPALRYRKAHLLLRPGGHLAFWSALHAFPVGFDPFFGEIQKVYDEIGESREGEWPPRPPEEIPDSSDEIEATGLFDDVETKRYVWEKRYTAGQYIALLDTFSGHISMQPEKREQLYGAIRDLIGRRSEPSVCRHWYSVLHVARRIVED